jgi:hypothetical protein
LKTYGNFITETKETKTLAQRVGQILRNYSAIPLNKNNATIVIQKIIGSELKYINDHIHPTKFPQPILGENVYFDLMKPSNKVRIFDYLSSLISTKTIRGDSFEGLIAGLYQGVTAQKKYDDTSKDENSSSKWDVELPDGKKISVKFLDSKDERPVLGNIKNDINTMFPELIDENLSLNKILERIGNRTSRELLNSAFSDVTHFLFAYADGLDLRCLLFERESLIYRYIEMSDIRYQPKQKGSYQIRINFNKLLPTRETDKKWTLFAPELRESDLEYLEFSDEKNADKLFGSDAYRIRGSILNAILKYGEFKTLGSKEFFVFDYNKYRRERGHKGQHLNYNYDKNVNL